jgi:outer membrane biosynthesis protein TonB
MTLAQGAKGTVRLIFEVPKNGTTGTSMLNISVLSSDTYFSGKAQVMLTVEKAKKAPGFGATAALLGTATVAVLLAASRRRRNGNG